MFSNVCGNMVQKGAEGPQSLAVATWRICGAARRRIEMPDIFHIGAEKPAQGNGSRLFSVEGEATKARRSGMKMFAWIFAAAISLMSLPALAGSPGTEGSVVLTGAQLCVGPGCRDRDDDRRWRHRGYGWDRGGGCRDVTVRERRDGEGI